MSSQVRIVRPVAMGKRCSVAFDRVFQVFAWRRFSFYSVHTNSLALAIWLFFEGWAFLFHPQVLSPGFSLSQPEAGFNGERAATTFF